MAPVKLRLGSNMSWGNQPLGIAPRSSQVPLLSQSQDNTLVILNEQQGGDQETMFKWSNCLPNSLSTL